MHVILGDHLELIDGTRRQSLHRTPTLKRELGFHHAVLSDFGFLEADHDFRNTRGSTCDLRHDVRYESDQVFIEIFHGMRDYEVGVEFGLLDTGKHLSFTSFLRRFFPDREKVIGESIADTPDDVKRAVRNLAHIFQETGHGILSGDPKVYEEMKTVRWWNATPGKYDDKVRE